MTLSLFLLAGLVANLVVGLLCIAAAGVAGVAAFFYIRAKNREVIDPALAASGGEAPSGLGEMRELTSRIEEMVIQQQDNGETQRAHLARKVDSVRESVESQHHAMTGLRQELRHEVQRRDAELAQIRTQLEATSKGHALPPIAHAALPPASPQDDFSAPESNMSPLSFEDDATPEVASFVFEEDIMPTPPVEAPAAPEAPAPETTFNFEDDLEPEVSPFAEVAFDAPAAEVLAPEGAREETPSPFPSMTFEASAPEDLAPEDDEPGLFGAPLAFESSEDEAVPGFDLEDTSFSITPYSFEEEAEEDVEEPMAPVVFSESHPFAFAEPDVLSFAAPEPEVEAAPEATPFAEAAPEATPFSFEEVEDIAPEEAPALPTIPVFEFETSVPDNTDEIATAPTFSFEDEAPADYEEAEVPMGSLAFEPAAAPAFAEETTVSSFAETSFETPAFDASADGGPPPFAFEEAVEETPTTDAPTAWISRPERDDAPTETIGGIQIERVGDVPPSAPAEPTPEAAGAYMPAFETEDDDFDVTLSASGAVPATPAFEEAPPVPEDDEFPSPVVASELAQEASFDFGIDVDAELDAMNAEPLAPEAAPEPIQMDVPQPMPEPAAPEAAPSAEWAPAEPAAKKVVPPFETPEGAEDLTVVSSIDEEMQRALYMAGVTSLDEIARWGRSDARRVSTEVGVSEETIMHQWVFEAQAALFDRFSR